MRDHLREVYTGPFAVAAASGGERKSSFKKSVMGDDYSQSHPGIYVRHGIPFPTGMVTIDTNMLAVMEFAPKLEVLDEIFQDSQGLGEEDVFSRVQIFTTKGRCWVYQAESPKGFSKYWWPYDPRAAGINSAGKMLRAEIPKGTMVGVGLVGNTTCWYIPSTYSKIRLSWRKLPPSWRLEVAPDMPSALQPASA